MLEEGVRRLAKGKNFAAFTTLLADGQPMTTSCGWTATTSTS